MGNLEQVIRDIIQNFEDDVEETEYVGTISKELTEQFQENKRAANLEKEIIVKKAELYLAQLKKEHDLEVFAKRKDELWEKIYEELGVSGKDREEPHQLNCETRTVTRVLDNEETIEIQMLKKMAKSPLQ